MTYIDGKYKATVNKPNRILNNFQYPLEIEALHENGDIPSFEAIRNKAPFKVLKKLVGKKQLCLF